VSRQETILVAESIRRVLIAVALVDRRVLAAGPSCGGRNLRTLLWHIDRTMARLDEAIATLLPEPVNEPVSVAGDPVESLRDRAAALLWTAFLAEDQTDALAPVIAIGTSEIATHAVYITIACERHTPGYPH
jgi:hypothetical protein